MTRKYFGTDGIRGIANTHPITPEVMVSLGKAIGKHFSNGKKKHTAIIGKDTRISGYMIENSLTAGLTSMGMDVLLLGPMPTPAVSHLVKSFAADVGIMISASHNPAADNGVKLFSPAGSKLTDEIEQEIEQLMEQDLSCAHVDTEAIGKARRIDDASGRYIEYMKGSVGNQSLKGIKLIVDCANGASYKVAPSIFKELGAEIIVLNDTPDGLNINKDCGAMHPEVISMAVKKNKANAGIAFDGDADRVIMVDETGSEVTGDHMLAIAGCYLLSKGTLKEKTIVVTEYSTKALDNLIESRGGKVVRVLNGDRYVLAKVKEIGCNLGGEYNGHMLFADYTTSDDGIMTALQILVIMMETNKPLSELKSILEPYPKIIENIKIKEKKKLEENSPIQKALNEAEESLGKKGRVFIRYSGTQNMIRIMAEAHDKRILEKTVEKLSKVIKEELT